MRRRIVGGALLAMLALATPAAAADRYAKPAPATGDCSTPALACTLETAVGGAAPNEVIHAAGGAYPLTASLWLNAAGVTLQGPASGERARLTHNGDHAVVVNASGITLRDVDLTADSATRVLHTNGSATSFTGERLRVTGTGSTGVGVTLHDGTLLRDSFVSVAAPGGIAVTGLRPGAATLVNVTARAAPTSGGIALMAAYHAMSDPSTQELSVVNSILQGDDSAGVDIDVQGDAATNKIVRVRIDHSSWQTDDVGASTDSELIAGAGNQTAEPLFALDGVTQAAGSPTINAGRTLAQLGTKDLFGGARPSGSAPDIGAHELQETPPAAGGGGGGGSDGGAGGDGGAVLPATTVSTPPAQTPRDTSAPAFTALSLSSRRFRAVRGTTFRWTLSEPATVTIALERRLPGLRVRRQGRLRCLRATAKLRRSLSGTPQRRCTVFRAAGTLRRAAPAGATAMTFSGRVGSRTLAVGAYRATAIATDAAGNRSAARRLTFTIVRR